MLESPILNQERWSEVEDNQRLEKDAGSQTEMLKIEEMLQGKKRLPSSACFCCWIPWLLGSTSSAMFKLLIMSAIFFLSASSFTVSKTGGALESAVIGFSCIQGWMLHHVETICLLLVTRSLVLMGTYFKISFTTWMELAFGQSQRVCHLILTQ